MNSQIENTQGEVWTGYTHRRAIPWSQGVPSSQYIDVLGGFFFFFSFLVLFSFLLFRACLFRFFRFFRFLRFLFAREKVVVVVVVFLFLLLSLFKIGVQGEDCCLCLLRSLSFREWPYKVICANDLTLKASPFNSRGSERPAVTGRDQVHRL